MRPTHTIPLLLLALAVSACEPTDARVVDREDASITTDDDAPRLRRVWADAGDYANPSPDGRLIAWVDWSTGDVAVYDVAADERRRITDHGTWSENGSWAEFPKFGPNGQRVVYSYGNSRAGRYELRYVVLGDTTQHLLRAILPSENWIVPLDWTDRGILFSEWRRARESGLFILDPESGEVTTVEPVAERTTEAYREGHISPAGRYVAYTNDGLNIQDLIDGSVEAIDIPINSLLGWTPDESGLVVHGVRGGRTAFFKIPVRDGSMAGEPTLIREGVPTIRPGGDRAGDTYYYPIPVDAPRLHIGSIDLEAARVLEAPTAVTTPMDGSAHIPIWSPDGTQLAYILAPLTAPGASRLMIRGAEGRKLRELATLDLGRINSMGWSADGSEIYLIPRDSEDLMAVSVRDGSVRTVMEDVGLRLAVSPDGRTVAVARVAEPGPHVEIMIGDLRSGRLDRLVSLVPGEDAGGLTFRDEDTILYVWKATGGENATELRALALEGAHQTTLARVELPAHFEILEMPMGLTADGSRALIGGRGPVGLQHYLFSVDLQSGTVKPLDGPSLSGHVQRYSLAPDASRLASVAGQARSELWALDRIDE